MELSLSLERLSVDEPDDDAFANAPTGKFIANRHTTSTNPYDRAPLSGFEDKLYDTRKKALADLRQTSGLVYQQSSTGKSPPAVIFRCGSHAFCTASVRLRTTPAGTFVLEGSVDSHAETFLLQTRGNMCRLLNYVQSAQYVQTVHGVHTAHDVQSENL
jgi:hypothetical protein